MFNPLRVTARWVARVALVGLFVLAIAGLGRAASAAVQPAVPSPRQAQTPRAGANAALLGPDWSAPHVPNQLLVKVADGASAAALGSATANITASGARVLRTVPALGLMVVESPEDAGLAQTAGAMASQPGIEWAEPNYIIALDLIPNDPGYLAQQSAYLQRMEMPAAWDYTTGSPDVIIAIVDTGVDLTHEDLQSGIWTNPGEIPGNGIDDDGNGFIDDAHGWNFAQNSNNPNDDYGHGTHVAGIAAARTNNGKGMAGVAGGATIMPVKIFPPPPNVIGTYEDLIRGIIYATDNGARVINLSLGATSYSRGEEAAVDYAWSHGVVVVAAAGNSGRENYHYPAAHPHVIAVAATDASDQLAGFSTWGDFVGVAAPGSGVWSTYRGNSYTWMSGTSMATPHVSGLAALILSLNPGLSPADVRALIENNADDLGTVGWDPHYGYGRINARRALAATPALTGTVPTPTPHPPLAEWPAGCQDLIADGSFEGGLQSWQASGDVKMNATRAFSGTQAAHFPGGPSSHGVLTRTLNLNPLAEDGTLWFAYRIENQDQGWGTSPKAPWDDWFNAEFRTDDGRVLSSLLRTGNSADTASDGLPWDRYVYRMQTPDLAQLKAGGPLNLVFEAGNDADNLPTDVWVDEVRFCVTSPPWPHQLYSPLAVQQ